MVGLALLRGLPGLGEVINNLFSWLVWQRTLFIAFPWHRVCPRWVFGLFSAFHGAGSSLPGGSTAPIGAVGPHNVGESLKTFHASFGLFWVRFSNFFLVRLVFIFPSPPGWEDTKPREQNGHTRPFCANAAVPGSQGWFCPSSRRLKILLETQGPGFPLGSPPRPWHVSDCGFTKAESLF